MLPVMCKCDNCGNVFHSDDAVTYMESHGERWSVCPRCLGSYEEVYACPDCLVVLEEDDDDNYVCPECGEVYY